MHDNYRIYDCIQLFTITLIDSNNCLFGYLVIFDIELFDTNQTVYKCIVDLNLNRYGKLTWSW